jgi:hypothetical protein
VPQSIERTCRREARSRRRFSPSHRDCLIALKLLASPSAENILEVFDMKRITKAVSAAFMSAIFAISSVIPLEAAPIQNMAPPIVSSGQSDVVRVQSSERPPVRRHPSDSRRPGSGSGRPPHSTGRPPQSTGRPPHSNRRPPPRYTRSPSNSWNGYRGSRYRRPGYRRRSDGWWYPAAAFTAGALIGAAASQPRTTVVHHHHGPSNNSRHVSWCMNRFRSYRVSDNTFQPNSGPRRQCVSPYSVH